MKQEKQNLKFSDVKPWTWILAGVAMGGVCAYFLDPARGRYRRSLIRDKGTHLANQANYYGGKLFRDLKNRGTGIIAQASHLAENKDADDETLMNRVRSEFGREIRHAKAIKAEVVNGEVTLSGPILSAEVDKLIRCVKRVTGVKAVINHLDAHESAGQISALQGKGKKYLQKNESNRIES